MIEKYRKEARDFIDEEIEKRLSLAQADLEKRFATEFREKISEFISDYDAIHKHDEKTLISGIAFEVQKQLAIIENNRSKAEQNKKNKSPDPCSQIYDGVTSCESHPFIVNHLNCTNDYRQLHHFGGVVEGSRRFQYGASKMAKESDLRDKVIEFGSQRGIEYLIEASRTYTLNKGGKVDVIYLKDMQVRIKTHDYSSEVANYKYQTRMNAVFLSVINPEHLLQNIEPMQLIDFADIYTEEEEWNSI